MAIAILDDSRRLTGPNLVSDGPGAVIDGRIVTGRVPIDIPEFLDAITQALLTR